MTAAFTRIGLGTGAVVMAILMLGPGQQDISAQRPGFGGGRVGGPGGPGGPGGRFGGPGAPGGPGLAAPLPLNRLNLTSEQRDRVRQVRESHREEQQALVERARTAHEALRSALVAPPFDEAVVRARSTDVASVQTDLAVLQARVSGEIYKVLTPEQQQELAKLQADRQERMTRLQERRSNRPRRGR